MIQPQPSCIEISSASNVHAFTRWKVRTSVHGYDWPRNSTKIHRSVDVCIQRAVHVVNCLERTRIQFSTSWHGQCPIYEPVTDFTDIADFFIPRLIQKR